MVTGSVNCVSRKFTAARIPLVKPLGAASTLESQLMSIVNALGDAGTVGRLTGVVTGVVTGVLGVWCRAASAPVSPFKPKNAPFSQDGDDASMLSNNPLKGCIRRPRTPGSPHAGLPPAVQDLASPPEAIHISIVTDQASRFLSRILTNRHKPPSAMWIKFALVSGMLPRDSIFMPVAVNDSTPPLVLA